MHNDNALKAAQLLVETMQEDDKAWFLFELAKALATATCWNEAESVALSIDFLAADSAQEKTLALTEIADRAATFKMVERACNLLLQAELAASEIKSAWQQAECLNKIARVWERLNDGAKAQSNRLKAIDIAKSGQEENDPQESVDSSSVLAEIVGDMAQAGQIAAAKDLARQIKSEGKRERAFAAIPH